MSCQFLCTFKFKATENDVCFCLSSKVFHRSLFLNHFDSSKESCFDITLLCMFILKKTIYLFLLSLLLYCCWDFSFYGHSCFCHLYLCMSRVSYGFVCVSVSFFWTFVLTCSHSSALFNLLNLVPWFLECHMSLSCAWWWGCGGVRLDISAPLKPGMCFISLRPV